MTNTKELIHEWFEGIWTRRDLSVIDRIMAPDAKGFTEGGTIQGPEQFKTVLYEPMVEAFPDIHVNLDGIVVEGEEAAVRWTVTGTHKGMFGPLAPTGRCVRFSGISWLKFRDGKLIEGTDHFNLGAVSAYLAEGVICSASVQPA